jgi:hypothetical protein
VTNVWDRGQEAQSVEIVTSMLLWGEVLVGRAEVLDAGAVEYAAMSLSPPLLLATELSVWTAATPALPKPDRSAHCNAVCPPAIQLRIPLAIRIRWMSLFGFEHNPRCCVIRALTRPVDAEHPDCKTESGANA